MKPPVETVRISKQGREMLIKIKRRTGLERWNDICRGALCRSLANESPPATPKGGWDSSMEIEWKTFAGDLNDELISAMRMRALADQVDLGSKDALAIYFRAHLERGIRSLQNVKDMSGYLRLVSYSED